MMTWYVHVQLDDLNSLTSFEVKELHIQFPSRCPHPLLISNIGVAVQAVVAFAHSFVCFQRALLTFAVQMSVT